MPNDFFFCLCASCVREATLLHAVWNAEDEDRSRPLRSEVDTTKEICSLLLLDRRSALVLWRCWRMQEYLFLALFMLFSCTELLQVRLTS